MRYEPESVQDAYASRASSGAPRWLVDGWVTSYTAIANGDLAQVTDDVPKLSGHPAKAFSELLAETSPV